MKLMNMQFFHFGHKDAGFFLKSCVLLSEIFQSIEWPELTTKPLPKDKIDIPLHYKVFVPIVSERGFMTLTPSVFDRLPEYVIEDLNNNKCSLILDYSNEAGTLDLCNFIKNELDKRGVFNFGNVMLVAQNRLLSKLNTDFSFFPFDYFIVITAVALYAQLDSTWNNRLDAAWQKGKEKNILCLNATPRMHRWLTVASLVNKNMLTDSLVSFPGQLYAKSVGISVDAVLNAAKARLGYLNDAICWLDKNAPLTVDEFAETGDALATKVDLSTYEKSIISIVTETCIGNSIERVTEKSFKAFALGHPSVVIGHPYSIKNIEELGFDAFREFIDHSYDRMDDWILRMNTAINEASNFIEAWHSGSIDVDKLQACSQKNRDWLLGGFFEFYSRKYAFPIISLPGSNN